MKKNMRCLCVINADVIRPVGRFTAIVIRPTGRLTLNIIIYI